jgi:hypothetical protein
MKRIYPDVRIISHEQFVEEFMVWSTPWPAPVPLSSTALPWQSS